MEQITWADFEKVDMRVGRVEQVAEYPEARKPSYRLRIDFGAGLGVLRSVAALRHRYTQDELLGRMVIAVTNFPPRQVGKHLSQVLVLAAVNADGSLCLIEPDGEVELGARIR